MPLADVIINEELGVERKAEPILGGIPLERGLLQGKGWFRLTREDGPSFVVEGTPAAWWPDGSVKWLHLCGLVDLCGSQANRFTLTPLLETVPDVGLTVEHVTPHEAIVTGGRLTARVRADVLNMLEVQDAETGNPLLVPPGLSMSYQLADSDETTWRPCRFELTRDPVKTVAQSANRVVLRLAGHVLDRQAREVAILRIFVEILREVPEIRLQPVWIPTGLPNEEKVRSFHLTVHSAIRSGERRYAFGNARGPGFHDVVQRYRPHGPRWPQARQVQLGSSFYKTEKRTHPQSSWVKATEGARAQGWCHLAGDQSGITAAMRYFWQEYPHSLHVDADAGTLTFGLIPEDAEPLDLRRYSPTLYGGGDAKVTMYETGTGPDEPRLSGARGIAKGHELTLRFHPPADTDIARQALSFLAPCRPAPSPGDFARSQAVGVLAPLDAQDPKRADAVIAHIMDYLVRERDVRGWYGLMNYGDVQMSYYSDLDQWAFDDGGHAWLNTESIPDYGIWINALRSGKPDWLEAAIAMTRHNRDVDTYHWGELKGLGTRHNVNHWGCRDKEWRVSMPLARRLHYYCTADPWTQEVIRETVAVYQASKRTKQHAPGFTGAFAGLLAKWEMSGDPADGRAVENMADLYARSVQETGRFLYYLQIDFATGEGCLVNDEPAPERSFFMDSFGGQHVLTEVAELINHQALQEAIARHARYRMTVRMPDGETSGRTSSATEFLAVAFRHTGDKRYRRELEETLSDIAFETEWIGGDSVLEDAPHERDPSQLRRNKFVCQLGRILIHVPFAQGALCG